MSYIAQAKDAIRRHRTCQVNKPTHLVMGQDEWVALVYECEQVSRMDCHSEDERRKYKHIRRMEFDGLTVVVCRTIRGMHAGN